ncbi:prophage tail fiber N-terminal domain-containing protein [Aeromonas veronii]|uniref:prophage tail fiber N-terminal domain-containing protein n=1 Tax=Aeromonas veronii TaxID=654 RepID=UPI002230803D|nr:prophage tail fiber N-terminal domain-containing protein [Aeromonas veronii]UZE61034.1 prophage tail fiber N-terminal domain-containing protein [Aeromonas veronii]
MIRIFGTMTDPSDSPVPGAIIELRAISSTSEVLLGSTVNHKCDQQGAYSFQLAAGVYDAYAQNDRCGDMDYLGTAKVSANSVDGDLHSILVDGGINITPPMLESALAAAQRAESAAALTAADRVSTGKDAESAKADSAAAKTAKDVAVSAASTAVSAKDSIVADAKDVRSLATQVATQATDVSAKHVDVVAKAAQVSAQEDMVSAKHGEVITKAAQVSDDASATQSAKNISVAAADTATQKAASAATHDASAQDAATRAENAASAVVGAVLDGGECDLSTGVFPLPITVAGKKYSTIWYVAVAGSVSGVAFDVGDLLRYTTAKTGYYFKVDAKDDVYSVNGEKGAVTVTPSKIGAEAAGTSADNILSHEAKAGAHPVSGIAGIAALIDAISPPVGCSEWDRLRSNIRAGHVPSDGQILKRADYPDMWAAIAVGKVPVVYDEAWLADPHKRASFTLGDGVSTFRVPDENGKYAGSLGALFQRGDGLNSAGTDGLIQGDAIRNISGNFSVNGGDNSYNIDFAEALANSGAFVPTNKPVSGAIPVAGVTSWAPSANRGNMSFDASRVVPTAADNHPLSATGCWVIKVMKSSKIAGL